MFRSRDNRPLPGRSSRRRINGAVAAAIAIALAVTVVPVATLAGEPSDPIVLPGAEISTVTADVDRDGEGELVRLAEHGGVTFLEVWDVSDGAWLAVLSVDARELSPSGDSVTSGTGGGALVTAQVDGRDRVLVLTGSMDPQGPCCLVIHEVTDDHGSLAVRPMVTPDVRGDFFMALDLDGDGTDELVATGAGWPPDDNSESRIMTFSILRRDGGKWATAASWNEPGGWYQLFPTDADDAPGSQVIASGDSGDVRRFSWVAGELVIEASPLGHFERDAGYIAGTLAGGLLHVGPEAVSLIEWPLGGRTRVTATYRTFGFPQVGVGGDAFAFVQRGLDPFGTTLPTTIVLDARLRPIGEVEPRTEATALWEAVTTSDGQWGGSRTLWPYFGPLAGDWTGSEAPFVAAGTLIRPAGEAFETQPISSIVGRPLGPLGPDDQWAALVDPFSAGGTGAYLFFGAPFSEAQTVILPVARLLDAQAIQAPEGEITVDRAIEIGEERGVAQVIASAAGMDLVVAAPPGTVVLSLDDLGLADHGAMEGSLRIEVAPPRRDRRDEEPSFERTVILIGLAGDASVHRWSGTFAPETPELTAWTEAQALSLEATVAGRSSPGSTVTVDGRTLDLDPFGGYRATVDAPPWPRDVIVVARDPFGGETRTTVQVIGLVDYRGLPWAPITGVLTVFGGAVLFLRTPRRRAQPALAMADDGQLEDIDGDVL